MLKDISEDTRDEALQDVELPRRVPARTKGLKEETKARSPSGEVRPGIERQRPESPGEQHPAEAKTRGKLRKGFLRRRPIASALGAILAAAVMGAGYVYFDDTQHFQSTDDAFIASRQIAIAPKVSGYVTQVPITDNQHVPKGGVIARIDERDYRVALEQADAQVAAAQAAIKNIDAQLNVQQAQINASHAQLEQAQAGLVFAKQQAERYEHLAGTGYGTVQNAQQYGSQLRQQQAGVQSFEAGLTVQERQIEALRAQRNNAEASLQQAIAQRDQAQLNLDYTTVTAAEPGRAVNLTALPGEFAQAGTNLTMFVPDEIWVTANFKETQLDHMRPGQPVTLSIDAYPEREIRGHVASVQPGSGTAFSLLPAQNATGNYVKIVQRVPVKIVIDNPPSDVALGPGMSVEPSVRVDPKPSLYERITGFFGWRKS
jgi:membrane fusion protein (multidrug efflux system)